MRRVRVGAWLRRRVPRGRNGMDGRAGVLLADERGVWTCDHRRTAAPPATCFQVGLLRVVLSLEDRGPGSLPAPSEPPTDTPSIAAAAAGHASTASPPHPPPTATAREAGATGEAAASDASAARAGSRNHSASEDAAASTAVVAAAAGAAGPASLVHGGAAAAAAGGAGPSGRGQPTSVEDVRGTPEFEVAWELEVWKKGGSIVEIGNGFGNEAAVRVSVLFVCRLGV